MIYFIAASLMLNVLMFAVLIDDDVYQEQQDFAIQYLGGEVNTIENGLELLEWYRDANEQLLNKCRPYDVNRAIRDTPLPPMKV